MTADSQQRPAGSVAAGPSADSAGAASPCSDSVSLDAWIVEHVADALIFADREGIIRRWNHGASRVFGFTAEDAIGQSLDLIIPERLRAAHWAGYHAAINSAGLKLDGRPTLTRGQHKEGGKLYVEMSFALVADARGEIVGSVAMARDVTAKVQKERGAQGSS